MADLTAQRRHLSYRLQTQWNMIGRGLVGSNAETCLVVVLLGIIVASCCMGESRGQGDCCREYARAARGFAGQQRLHAAKGYRATRGRFSVGRQCVWGLGHVLMGWRSGNILLCMGHSTKAWGAIGNEVYGQCHPVVGNARDSILDSKRLSSLWPFGQHPMFACVTSMPFIASKPCAGVCVRLWVLCMIALGAEWYNNAANTFFCCMLFNLFQILLL